MQMPDSLAEKILRDSGAITRDRLLELKAEVKSTHVPLVELALHYGILSEEELTEAFARTLNLPYLNLSSVNLKPVHLRALPEHLSRRYRVVVFDIEPDQTKLVASDAVIPPAAHAVLVKALGANYRLHITTPSTLHAALDVYRQHGLVRHSEKPNSNNVQMTWENPKVLESIHHILEQAVLRQADTVHIEPQANTLSVRFRIDGALKEVYKLPLRLSQALNIRLKSMAGLSGPAPEEGQFKIDSHNMVYQVEVLTLPVLNGEKITLNLFNESSKAPNLEELGLWGNNLVNTNHALISKHGLVVVAGPRDSGKATTMYSLLSSLHLGKLNVLTIENRVSYKVPGASQLELGPMLPNYETALNVSLKQNPEVLLLGAIQSLAIADSLIDLSASCLVLSAVNASDAFKSLAQLESFGVESFRLAHSTRLIISTRLVRKLCEECKQPVHPSNDVLKGLIKALGVSNVGGIKALHRLEKQAASDGLGTLEKTDLSSTETSIKRLWQAKDGGCAHCNYTGYRGRIGLQEVLEFSDDIKAKLAAGAGPAELQNLALKSGFIPLSIDGLVKALRGLTSATEILSTL